MAVTSRSEKFKILSSNLAILRGSGEANSRIADDMHRAELAERSEVVSIKKSQGHSCKTCNAVTTKGFFKWCRVKNKRVQEYNICHIHKEM